MQFALYAPNTYVTLAIIRLSDLAYSIILNLFLIVIFKTNCSEGKPGYNKTRERDMKKQ